MISRIAGTLLSKNTKTRVWWAKLAVAIVISNIFFFLLFSGSETSPVISKGVPVGWVEMQIKAELLTQFHSGKKVLLIHRKARKQLEAMLDTAPTDPEMGYTILVKESEAEILLKHDGWEIVPFLKKLTFAPISKGTEHEISY